MVWDTGQVCVVLEISGLLFAYCASSLVCMAAIDMLHI